MWLKSSVIFLTGNIVCLQAGSLITYMLFGLFSSAEQLLFLLLWKITAAGDVAFSSSLSYIATLNCTVASWPLDQDGRAYLK